jgi:parallel beta-helix repeat protein
MRRSIDIRIFGIFFGICFAIFPIINKNINFNPRCNELNVDSDNLKTSKVSGLIYINGNSGWIDFKNDGNCTGEGTYSEPYVIEDLVIDSGATGDCILIENSDVYFKIENCTLYNTGSGQSGIRLSYVNNAQLINNDCSFNGYGIRLDYSDNITISENKMNNNFLVGMELTGSDNITISGNTANHNNDCGLYLYECENLVLLGNMLNYNRVGIYLESCNNNDVMGNNVNNNYPETGIFVSDCDSNTISGNNVNYNHDRGISLWYSDNNEITENNVSFNNDHGIFLDLCSYNDIVDNTINDNRLVGVYLVNSLHNDVSRNTANNNEYGIQLLASDYNTVTGNILCGNTENIVENFSEGNIIQGNGCGGIAVPGYFPFLLIGVISIMTMIIVKLKYRKRGNGLDT